MLVSNRFGQNLELDSKGSLSAMKWKKELSREKITMIEKTCSKPMTKLGYANFSNQMKLKDILTKTKEELWPYGISLFTKKSAFARGCVKKFKTWFAQYGKLNGKDKISWVPKYIDC